ncbi:MAG: hypothetical protein DWQ06_11140 [Calditrichaeota bacterium]|nr:MAG: hypothetical protein DWQ06_11140 [Calditrichota bacterium]
MKDSGIEWLGEIPEHWEKVKVSHYIYLRHGFQFRDYDFTDFGCKIIKISQLLPSGKLDLENCDTIDSNRISNFEEIVIRNGDVLMALTGGTIGKVVKANGVKEIILQNYRVGNFFPKDINLISKEFIFWIMKSELLFAQINFAQRETGQPNIGKEDFRDMFFALPSPPEQETIANYLDEKTAKTDDSISKAESQIEFLKEYRTALISEAVTGKIDVRG